MLDFAIFLDQAYNIVIFFASETVPSLGIRIKFSNI